MTKHPDSTTLGRGLGRAVKHLSVWHGEVYRATSVEYANRDDLLTGAGAKSAGGRWNPPKSFATVYTSLTPEAAQAEYLAQHRYFGWPISTAMPFVMVGIEVRLGSVLDLTDGAVRKALGVSAARLLDASWRKAAASESLTQAIGRLAFEAKVEGVVVPSAAEPGSANLVYFPGNLVPPGSWVRVVNRDKLPPPA